MVIHFFLPLLLAITPAEYSAAQADRAQFPAADHGYYYYVSTAYLTGECRTKTETALALRVASSSAQPIVEKCTPLEVADGLWRIELRDLKWDWRLFHQVAHRHPYDDRGDGLPLVLHAGWLVAQLSDGTESNAYYLLLYGTDKLSRADFEKFWGVNSRRQDAFGLIGRSTASDTPGHVGIRWVERNPTNQGHSRWYTRDSSKLTLASDPREHVRGDFKHEAEEHFVLMPKVSITTGQRGSLLAPLLSDAAGTRQEEAPPKIVTDVRGFRGQAAIRNPGSCISCHATGLREPGVNEFRSYIAAGVEAYTDKTTQEQLELFHFSDVGKEFSRDNEDLALGFELVCGCDGPAAAEAFAGALEYYDRDLSLASAAAELGATPEELSLAIASYSDGTQGQLFAGLAHDKPVPRAVWEDGLYHTAYVALQVWRKR